MKPKIRQHLFGVLALFACAAASANERDWLYFPMYHNDSAHAVHYKALRLRPDGLLQGATRYPGHSPEGTWAKKDWDAASYEYYTQLIDCDTGLSIDTSHQLITDTGETVARRDFGRDEWIADLVRTGQSGGGAHRWPSNSERFLACAGYRDPQLKKSRARNANKVPFIGYQRLVTTLSDDTSHLVGKGKPGFDAEALEKSSKGQPDRLFEGLRRQYADWLSGFTQRPAPNAVLRARAPEGAQARALAWLQERRVEVNTLEVRNDGSIEFSEPIRGLFGIEPPPEAPGATDVRLQARLDCHSGIVVAKQLLWVDESGKVLLKQALPWEDVWGGVQRSYLSDWGNEPQVFSLWPGGEQEGHMRAGYLICRAAAAQCASAPSEDDNEPLQFTAEDFPETLQTPEALLLHAHALWQQRRSQRLPACIF